MYVFIRPSQIKQIAWSQANEKDWLQINAFPDPVVVEPEE